MKYPVEEKDSEQKMVSVEMHQDQIESLERLSEAMNLGSRSAVIRWAVDFVTAKYWSKMIKKEVEATKEFHLNQFEKTKNGKIRVPEFLHGDDGGREFESVDQLNEWFKGKMEDYWGQDMEYVSSKKSREMRADLKKGECPVCGIKGKNYKKNMSYLAMHINRKGGEHDEFLDKHDLEDINQIKNWLTSERAKSQMKPNRLDSNFPELERFPQLRMKEILSQDKED